MCLKVPAVWRVLTALRFGLCRAFARAAGSFLSCPLGSRQVGREFMQVPVGLVRRCVPPILIDVRGPCPCCAPRRTAPACARAVRVLPVRRWPHAFLLSGARTQVRVGDRNVRSFVSNVDVLSRCSERPSERECLSWSSAALFYLGATGRGSWSIS